MNFINLTNGLKCLPLDNPHFIRIQSTALEQKLFNNMISDISDDLLYNLAIGEQCIIHDQSEKHKYTRAIWQGMEFIEFCCNKLWFDMQYCQSTLRYKNEINVTNYFDVKLNELTYRNINKIKYFRKYAVSCILWEPCECKFK
jgi:hypothetical protein